MTATVLHPTDTAPRPPDVVRRLGRRVVRASLAGDVVAARVSLVRHVGDVAAGEWTWDRPARGRRAVSVPVPREALAGPARVRVETTDVSGRHLVVSEKVFVPAR